MQIRSATRDDVIAWYGKASTTMRAIVVEHDGQVLGIAGLALMHDHVQAFSAYKPELRQFPMAMARAALRFRGMLERQAVPVLALCSETEPTAPRLLARLGFVQQDERVWRHG